MIRYAYNNQLQPPAPFVLVAISNAITNTEIFDVPAQLDTAADRTVVPLHVVQALNLPLIGSIQIGSFGGNILSVDLYAAIVTLQPLPPISLEVIGHPGEAWVLLGRDVLNNFQIFLDGPKLGLGVS